MRIQQVILACVLTCFSLVTLAKELPSARIAVIDLQAALMQSKQVQEEFKQAEQKLSSEQNRVRQLAEEVRSLQEKLQKDESIMSAEQKRQANKQIEEKHQEYQFLGSRLQKQVQDIEQEIINRNQGKLEKAVDLVLKEKNIDLLLNKQATPFAKPEFDITSAVIEKLNK